ncbi:MAG: UDP-N-acetylmuramoyl-L-alanine--D-glutamate ligase [Chloroflexia bacterium]
MQPLVLRGKKVLVMGLGLHGGGLGVTRFLLREGAEVTVTDLRTAEELAPSIQALEGEPVRFVLGEHRVEDFVHADLVIRNPAVPYDSPFLQLAREHGIPVEMEMTLFFALCPGRILGVTGTKGKSTTTALLGEILRRRFPDTVVAGNIRVSALEALWAIRPETPVVLELSSWQLEGLGERGFSPHLAVVTNLYPDHLNRYPSWEDYVEAKRQIYRHQRPQDILVLNAEDPEVRSFARDAPGRVAWFGVELQAEGDALRTADGTRVPLGAGAASIVEERVVWIGSEGDAQPVCELAKIRLVGRHNRANVLAATAAAALFGVDLATIGDGIASFAGLADRLEWVAEVGGVTFRNDTTSTTPASTIAALQALEGGIVLIAGGADKGLDYEAMARMAAERTRGVALLEGTAADKLERALRTAGARLLGRFGDLRAAVRAAASVAQPGDTVLLSPGCASFGLFRHEFERGERFREAVHELASRSGRPASEIGTEG